MRAAADKAHLSDREQLPICGTDNDTKDEVFDEEDNGSNRTRWREKEIANDGEGAEGRGRAITPDSYHGQINCASGGKRTILDVSKSEHVRHPPMKVHTWYS